MYYIYVLKQKNDRYYYGYTNNLARRMSQHQNGNVKTTKGQDPRLVYYEECASKADATKREKFIKGGQGREQIKKLIASEAKQNGPLAKW